MVASVPENAVVVKMLYKGVKDKTRGETYN